LPLSVNGSKVRIVGLCEFLCGRWPADANATYARRPHVDCIPREMLNVRMMT